LFYFLNFKIIHNSIINKPKPKKKIMAPPILVQKTLQGVVKVPAVNAQYVFSLPLQNFPPSPGSQPLDLIQIEEVWIEVGEIGVPSTGSPTIQLPPIQYFNGGWNPKIYITNVNNDYGTTIIPTPEDALAVPPIVAGYVNGSLGVSIDYQSQSAFVKIVNSDNYAVFLTPVVIP